MTDKEGDARFLASRRSSFVSSFSRRTSVRLCHTHALVCMYKHTDALKNSKQRYSISSLETRVHVYSCVCACHSHKVAYNLLKSSIEKCYENVHANAACNKQYNRRKYAQIHTSTHTHTHTHIRKPASL